MITVDNQEEMIAWAAERVGNGFRSDAKAIGQLRQGELNAVVVYDTFSESDCYIHIASDGSKRWATRTFFFHAFHYPFVQCDLPRVTGLVPAKNEAALRFDLKLGFQVEGRSPEAAPGDDVIILGMLRRNCVFIPKEYRHGQE